MQRNPGVHVLLVGSDEVAYGQVEWLELAGMGAEAMADGPKQTASNAGSWLR